VETAIFVNLAKFTAHAGITGVAPPTVHCTLLTEWQVSFAFFQPGSAAAALSGATFRFALKETPTSSPLIFSSSLTNSGAVYTADFSSVDSAALRTLIGDQPTIEVVGEIEWTISSRRERVHFPVTVTNAWARPDDAAPDPVAEASIVWFNEQLATRAVRFDVAQQLTTQQKTQGRDNLGITGTGGSAAWADITGKPSTFPPSAHTHSASDIVSGALAVANGGTGSSTASAARAALGLRLAQDVQPYSAVLDALLPLNVLDTGGDVGTTLQLGSGTNFVDDNATTSGGDAGEIRLVGGDAYGDASIQRNGGDAGLILMLGGHASDQSEGGAAGTINTSASGQYLGGSLLMNATDRNAGSINTQAGGNLTMGTANVSGPAVAGTLLTDASSLPAANLTGTIANARLPATISGLTSISSTTFVGALTGVASGNLVAGGALGTPSSANLANATGLPTAGLVDDAVTLAKMAAGTAGNLISYDASGNPVAVATGTAGQVLTSRGAGLAPTMQAIPVIIQLACSDETSALTAGTAKVTFRMPYAMTLTGVRASVTTAPTGSTLIVDINEGGTSILSTKLSIDATEKTSTTAASAAVISDSALADDAEITIDIDQIGSTVAGAGLKVTLIGTRA
jgi:hypothetical protein